MVQLSHDRSLILEIAQFYLLALEVDNLNCAFGNVHVYHATVWIPILHHAIGSLAF